MGFVPVPGIRDPAGAPCSPVTPPPPPPKPPTSDVTDPVAFAPTQGTGQECASGRSSMESCTTLTESTVAKSLEDGPSGGAAVGDQVSWQNLGGVRGGRAVPISEGGGSEVANPVSPRAAHPSPELSRMSSLFQTDSLTIHCRENPHERNQRPYATTYKSKNTRELGTFGH
eukprot:g19959.t1